MRSGRSVCHFFGFVREQVPRVWIEAVVVVTPKRVVAVMCVAEKDTCDAWKDD